MQGKDEVSIVITFIFGFVGGFYFFLTGYAPYIEEVKENIFAQDTQTVESLIIIGKQYGGCERAGLCASFQLEHDGSYRFLPESILRGAVPVQGTLTRSMMNDVRAVTLPSKLRSASRTSTAEGCASYYDGIDYSYEIVRNGELFLLDTCTTTLSQNPDLINVFNTIWNYVEN
jgi:hypothetical protein